MIRLKTLLKEAVIVILIALVLSGACYALRPVFQKSKGPGENTVDGEQGPGKITALSFEDARKHFKEGTALFADARSLKAYQTGHIMGAIHLDPNMFDDWSADFFSQVSPDQTIITYCEGVRCSLSVELADQLSMMGYEKVYYLKDGWGLWKREKLPSNSN